MVDVRWPVAKAGDDRSQFPILARHVTCVVSVLSVRFVTCLEFGYQAGLLVSKHVTTTLRLDHIGKVFEVVTAARFGTTRWTYSIGSLQPSKSHCTPGMTS